MGEPPPEWSTLLKSMETRPSSTVKTMPPTLPRSSRAGSNCVLPAAVPAIAGTVSLVTSSTPLPPGADPVLLAASPALKATRQTAIPALTVPSSTRPTLASLATPAARSAAVWPLPASVALPVSSTSRVPAHPAPRTVLSARPMIPVPPAARDSPLPQLISAAAVP